MPTLRPKGQRGPISWKVDERGAMIDIVQLAPEFKHAIERQKFIPPEGSRRLPIIPLMRPDRPDVFLTSYESEMSAQPIPATDVEDRRAFAFLPAPFRPLSIAESDADPIIYIDRMMVHPTYAVESDPPRDRSVRLGEGWALADAEAMSGTLRVFAPPPFASCCPMQHPVWRNRVYGPYAMEALLAHEIAHLMYPNLVGHYIPWQRAVEFLGYPEEAWPYSERTGEFLKRGHQRYQRFHQTKGLTAMPRSPSIARLALATFPLTGQSPSHYLHIPAVQQYVETVYPRIQYDYQTLDLADPYGRMREDDPDRDARWREITATPKRVIAVKPSSPEKPSRSRPALPDPQKAPAKPPEQGRLF